MGAAYHDWMFPARTYARFFRRYVESTRGVRRPIEVSWFISTDCPIRCGGCLFFGGDGRPSFAADRVLTLDEKLAIVAQLRDIRLPFLAITGGEPFLDRDLMPLVRAARDAGIACGITTNGLAAGPAEILAFDGLLHVVWISLDGFAPAHEAIRGPGTYERSLATLKALAGVSRRTRVGVSTVLNRHNIAGIPRFLEFLLTIGVERVGLKVNVVPELRPDFAEHGAVLEEIVALKKAHPRFIALTPEFIRAIPLLSAPAHAKDGCRLDLWAHPAILPDGRLSACAAYPVIAGDLTREHIASIMDRGGPDAFAAAGACPGCVRGDLPLYDLFLGRPWYRISPADALKILHT